MTPDDYRIDGYQGGWGCKYVEPAGVGFTVIPVLQFLNGEPWDEVALAYVHALRPSRIRVNNTGTWKLDAMAWRVSVHLDADDRTIRKMTQEVKVGLPEDIANGHELDWRLADRPSFKRTPTVP